MSTPTRRLAARRHVADRRTAADVLVLPPIILPPPPPVILPPPSTIPGIPLIGVYPNEPAGLSLITEYTFPDPILAQQGDVLMSGGWHSIYNGPGLLTQITDLLAPSPGHVAQFSYPVGFTDGHGPATLWRGLPSIRKGYMAELVKISNPWQGDTSNVNKLGYFFTSANGSIFLCFYGPSGGPFELRVFPQLTGSAGQWLLPNVAHVPLQLGQWHFIEWFIDMNGGLVAWAVDSVIVGNLSGVAFPTVPFTEYHLDPVWGGVGGPAKSEQDYEWVNRIHISGS